MIIFGMKESESEDLQEKVQEVLAELGEKPPFEVNRFGNRKDAGRPIKVKFKNGEVVCTLLKKSSRLRRSEKFRNVFLCPDRTQEQRTEQRRLVSELKKRILEQPEKKHFIKDGKINTSDLNFSESSDRGSV